MQWFSQDEIATAKQLRNDGLSFSQIGAKLDRSRCSIAGLMYRVARGSTGVAGRRRLETDRELVYRIAVSRGMTAQQIADSLGITRYTVYGNLRRYGLRPNRPRRA